MIELTKEVIKRLDTYDDDQEFFAYKLTAANGKSYFYQYYQMLIDSGRFTFIIEGFKGQAFSHEVGTTLEYADADKDDTKECAEGINVGTREWVAKACRDFIFSIKTYGFSDYESIRELFPTRCFKLKFTKKDIACAPEEVRFFNEASGTTGVKTGIKCEKIRLTRAEIIEEVEDADLVVNLDTVEQTAETAAA